MLPGKARGGPVFSGQPYMVGERGPELFMPNRSGSIVPNGQLMGSGTGMGTQAINLNGEFRIKGTDLVLTLAEANYKLGR
jgi:phage-related minor tail protein